LKGKKEKKREKEKGERGGKLWDLQKAIQSGRSENTKRWNYPLSLSLSLIFNEDQLIFL
jgi:hypothetical protein